MEKNSKIFVAGHRGLVGSALIRKLRLEGYTNLLTATREELDLRRQEPVEAFFKKYSPDYVFLSAAKVGGILANNTYKAEFIYDNLTIAANVINAAFRTKVKKLLNLGSSCIYPKLAPQPMKEEYLLSGLLEQTNEPYAIAKIAAIKLCRYYNEQYGTDYISAMPTNLYGPNDNFDLEVSHVLAAMIRKFYLARLLREQDERGILDDLQRSAIGFGLDQTLRPGDIASAAAALRQLGITAESVVLWGTGAPYREFLHVDDLADALLYLMNNYNHREIGELINVGTGLDRTIADIASTVKSLSGFTGNIVYDGTKPDGTPRKLLDVSRLSSLKWKARISFDEGLKGLVAWYAAARHHVQHAAP